MKMKQILGLFYICIPISKLFLMYIRWGNGIVSNCYYCCSVEVLLFFFFGICIETESESVRKQSASGKRASNFG